MSSSEISLMPMTRQLSGGGSGGPNDAGQSSRSNSGKESENVLLDHSFDEDEPLIEQKHHMSRVRPLHLVVCFLFVCVVVTEHSTA